MQPPKACHDPSFFACDWIFKNHQHLHICKHDWNQEEKKKKKDSSNLNTEMRLNLQNSAVPTATVSARFLI